MIKGTYVSILACTNPFLKETQSINIQLTHECNFSCVYCSDSVYKSGKKFLEKEKIKLFLQNFFKYSDGNTEILLLGGEPTLHKDIVEIIKMCEEFQYVSKVVLVTNGSNLNSILEHQYTDKFTISITYHNTSKISFTRYIEIFETIKKHNINLNIKYVVDGNETLDKIIEKYNITTQYSDFGTLHPIYHVNFTEDVYKAIEQNFIERKRINTLWNTDGSYETKTEFELSEIKDIFHGMFCNAFNYCYIISPDGYLYTSCDKNLNTRFNCFLQKDIDKFIKSNKYKTCKLSYCNCKKKYKKWKSENN